MDNILNLKAGFIGLGLIGCKRAASLPKGLKVNWGVDPLETARNKFTNLFNCQTFANLNDSLLDNIDLLFISTTHNYLADYAIQSINNGLHTFIEKPGAINLESVLRIENAYNKSTNIVISFGFNHRFHPAFIELHRRLGTLEPEDEIQTIRATYGHGGRKGYEKEWRMDKSKSGGGELLDQGSHLIDLIHYLTDKSFYIEYSKLRNNFWKADVEDNVIMILNSSDKKITANLNASWTEWKNKFLFELFTKQNQYSIKGLGGSYGIESLTIYEMSKELGPPKTTIFEYPGADFSWNNETNAFLNKIKSGSFDKKSLTDTVKLHAMIDKIYNFKRC